MGLDEAYLPLVLLWKWRHELPNRLEPRDEFAVVLRELTFRCCELSAEMLPRREHLSELNKRPHDLDVDFDRSLAT
jgi:hypothetical protein